MVLIESLDSVLEPVIDFCFNCVVSIWTDGCLAKYSMELLVVPILHQSGP